MAGEEMNMMLSSANNRRNRYLHLRTLIIEDLPAELTIDILSRLPVKTIVHCKLVCKKWRNLVSDASFVNLHLSRSPTGLVVQQCLKYFSYPETLKWVEIEDKVDHHHLRYDPPMSLDLSLTPILQNSQIDLIGSINGLIFLWQRSPDRKFDDVYICNPITREIMILPKQRNYERGHETIVYGFGVSSLTREYKVVRIFQGEIPLEECRSSQPMSVFEAEVYTLGTGQWRSLGKAPYRLDGSYLSYGTFLNDNYHWIVYDEDAPEKICTFDLNKETFQLFPSPPSDVIEESCSDFQNLVVLKGSLCKYDASHSQLSIWMMKEYGIKKSWHKEMVITEAICDGLEWPLSEPISLIDGFRDGRILIVSYGNMWVFYPTSDTIEEIEMFDWFNSGLVYRPSFLKLQNFKSERVHMF